MLASSDGHPVNMNNGRLEASSDGVIAIIMVMASKVPQRGSPPALMA